MSSQRPRLPVVAQDVSSPTRTTTGGFSRFIQSLLAKGLATLRPLSPQLIPLVIFLLLIPLLVVLAVVAGWVVWRAAAVNWNVDVYLQYGYVCVWSFLTRSHFVLETETESPHMPSSTCPRWSSSNPMISRCISSFLYANQTSRSGIS